MNNASAATNTDDAAAKKTKSTLKRHAWGPEPPPRLANDLYAHKFVRPADATNVDESVTLGQEHSDAMADNKPLKFLRNAMDVFCSEERNKTAFRPLVHALYMVEDTYVKNPPPHKAKLGIQYRPGYIADWNKLARFDRPGGRSEGITEDEIPRFSRYWHAWWRGIQPEWREQGQNAGSWDTLISPGPLGFLSLVTGLFWWGRVCSDGSDDWIVWKAARDDVVDVMMAIKAYGERGYGLSTL